MTATVTHLRVADAQRMPPSIPPMAVHAYLHAILEAANSLLRNDFEVVAFQADIVTRLPVLWIKDCPHTRALIRVGQASYDRTGSDATGAYRIGVFERLGVTVQWLERVPG
jgi:hypothetical protein